VTCWPEILAFLHTGITNAGSEGTNRVIKTVARDRLRISESGEPAATDPHRHYPPPPRTPQPRLTSKSLYATVIAIEISSFIPGARSRTSLTAPARNGHPP
jgi:hypothetical protein